MFKILTLVWLKINNNNKIIKNAWWNIIKKNILIKVIYNSLVGYLILKINKNKISNKILNFGDNNKINNKNNHKRIILVTIIVFIKKILILNSLFFILINKIVTLIIFISKFNNFRFPTIIKCAHNIIVQQMRIFRIILGLFKMMNILNKLIKKLMF